MAENLIGCPCCKGRKTLIGLGMMIKDCEECKGIGWIYSKADEEDKFYKSEKEIVQDNLMKNNNLLLSKSAPRRGRPPGYSPKPKEKAYE